MFSIKETTHDETRKMFLEERNRQANNDCCCRNYQENCLHYVGYHFSYRFWALVNVPECHAVLKCIEDHRDPILDS